MSIHNKKGHTHKYRKEKNTWLCVLCPHFLPGNVIRGVIGRDSICWECDETFTVDEIAAMKKKPICIDCDVNNPVRQINNVINT